MKIGGHVQQRLAPDHYLECSNLDHIEICQSSNTYLNNRLGDLPNIEINQTERAILKEGNMIKLIIPDNIRANWSNFESSEPSLYNLEIDKNDYWDTDSRICSEYFIRVVKDIIEKKIFCSINFVNIKSKSDLNSDYFKFIWDI